MPGRPSSRFAQKVKEMKSVDSLFRKSERDESRNMRLTQSIYCKILRH